MTGFRAKQKNMRRAAQNKMIQEGMNMPQAKLSDPSGRGKAEGFKVIFPMMQHPYTEAEIQAVVDVMRNAEGQTQGKYLEKFEKESIRIPGPSTPMISSARSRPRPRLWWPFTCWASPAT